MWTRCHNIFLIAQGEYVSGLYCIVVFQRRAVKMSVQCVFPFKSAHVLESTVRLYDNLTATWADDVRHDPIALESIKSGGYYATSPIAGLTVIALNVNYWVYCG